MISTKTTTSLISSRSRTWPARSPMRLDHRMLLPTRNHLISLHEEGANLRVTCGDRMWSFPRDECVLLPIANTTAELLADHIAGRLRQEMAVRGWTIPRVLRVQVEESFGQSAEVEWRGDSSAGI